MQKAKKLKNDDILISPCKITRCQYSRSEFAKSLILQHFPKQNVREILGEVRNKRIKPRSPGTGGGVYKVCLRAPCVASVGACLCHANLSHRKLVLATGSFVGKRKTVDLGKENA